MAHVASSSNHPSYGPRGWQSVYRPVLIILFCLGIFIILPIFLFPRFGVNLEIRGRTLVGLGGTLAAELVLFAFLMRWLKGQGRSLKDIGWSRPTTASAIVFGIAFALGYAFYTLNNPLIADNATEVSLFKLAGIVVGIFGAIVEECVFRGYLMTELEHVNVTPGIQILVSGASFAIIHVGFDSIGILLTFLMGMVMATAFVIGKRSLTPSLISHVLINIVIEPWLLLFIITMYSRL
jgi:membrane protease YdiL (CAAX protease family)